jgi:hypothetical protein
MSGRTAWRTSLDFYHQANVEFHLFSRKALLPRNYGNANAISSPGLPSQPTATTMYLVWWDEIVIHC